MRCSTTEATGMAVEKPSIRLKTRRTKIVATLGPASNSLEKITELIEAGANVFRLNMSHGEHAGHRQVAENIRRASENLGCTVGILADLCGPKIRTGSFEGGGVDLVEGERVTVTTREVLGGPGLIPTIYEHFAKDVNPDDTIFLNDGVLELRVEDVEGTEVGCRVVRGGRLSDRKGINLPGVDISAPALTEKDREDVEFALELGVDMVALSFVRRAEEVEELRQLVSGVENPPFLVSKIEKPEALQNINAILEATDAIMVARGDLGVELPPEEIPVAQNQLVDRARAFHKPVIVATQMLESMVKNSRPTRAEVSDVSAAVVGGADAVMLSAETAAGRHPVAAVEMMDRVAREMENYLWERHAHGGYSNPVTSESRELGEAFGNAIAALSRDLRTRAVVILSRGRGATAATVSSARPASPTIAVSRVPRVCGFMCLLWGVIPHLVPGQELEHPHELARRLTAELGLGQSGQRVLEVGGFAADKHENVPTISIVEL